jgi:hypothetical protein
MGGRLQKEGLSELVLGGFPGYTRDIAAGDTDVGQFAVAEPIELAKALVVTAPLPIDANQLSQEHVVNPL